MSRSSDKQHTKAGWRKKFKKARGAGQPTYRKSIIRKAHREAGLKHV